MSSLSTVGVAQSLAPESTYTSVGSPERAVAQRRKRLILLSVGGAVLLACALALVLKKSNSSAVERAAPATQLAAPVAKPSEPSEPAGATEPSAPKIDLQALPMESATVETPSAPAPVRAQGGAPRIAAPAAAAPSASAKTTKTPAPKWRQDPGF